MLISNTSYVCDDVLTMFEKALQLPRGSDITDVLAIHVCPDSDSEVAFKLSNQVQSLKEAVSISEFFSFKACSALLILLSQNEIY